MDTRQAPVSFPRRASLAAAGCSAALFALGGAGKLFEQKSLLRPPGGQDEADFTARCLKCDRCRSICPTSAIGVAHVEDGITAVRTPVMKFRLGHCTFCNKCVEVCPTQALKPFDIKTVKIGLATVTDRCIAWNAGGCAVCHKACTYGAITLDRQNRPVVDLAKCNGCGLCEKICPALALKSYGGGTTRGIEVRPIQEAAS